MLQRSNRLMRTMFWCGLVSAASAAPALAADVTGDWLVKDGTAIIRIADCDGAMWGVVAWEKIPGGRDTKNPDATKKNRPFLAMPILISMKPGEEKGEWEGHVYNAKDGKTYESKIHLARPDALEIEGCVLGFLCGGEIWTRVTSLPPGPATATAGTAKGAPAKRADKAQPKAPAKSTAKTTGFANSPAAAENDPVGDVCLLPDVARGTH
ncbi:MAG: DUF2147 domain-containing protein [Proteobacteria bacterium]|nr:MAG: DUF2147 domain-containing protein [Pseudomonadota bacterium]